MKRYFVYRNGETKLTGVSLEKADDGTLWAEAKKSCPLVNSSEYERLGFTKEQIADWARNGEFEKIPAEAFCYEGMNPGGLEVITQDELQARAQRKWKERTPAQIERDTINDLFYKAGKEEDNPNDSIMYWKYRNEATSRLEQWKKDYPNDWIKEQAEDLVAEAKEEESLASGALTYDADGWIDEKEQWKRHDEHIAKAKSYREQAKELLENITA
jgi:hypothetical protein